MTVAQTARSRARRTTGGIALGREASVAAKRLAAAILEVLAGLRTPQQAAQALELSLPRYYQVEAAGLRGLLAACEAKPRGRQPDPRQEVAALQRQNERLQRDVARQQALVRVAQRTVGLPPPAAPTKAAAGQRKKRKPVARALTVAARLRTEAEVGNSQAGDYGVSPTAE
jgi:hypothetical protein